MTRQRPWQTLIGIAMAALLAAACSFGAPEVQLPEVQLPTFDTSGLTHLLEDAAAEVGRVTSSISLDELPADIVALLEEHDIPLPPLPSNAAEICSAMGTPGVSTVAGAGLKQVLESFVVGGEAGLVVGLLVTVVLKTCPDWSPHLANALEDFLE